MTSSFRASLRAPRSWSRWGAAWLVLAVAVAPAAVAQDAPATDPATPRSVLFVGNSLTYVNNLPALLRAIGDAEGTPIRTETWAAPGGTLAERVKEGHVAQALRERHVDVLVLQEQGGNLAACMAGAQSQRKAPCAASLRAYTSLARLAAAQGGKTLVFTTWGPDERWQGRLDRSARLIATQADAEVFDAAGALAALRKAEPGAALFPDGVHPNTRASLMVALALYRKITGAAPGAHDLRVTAPLLPVNAAVSPDAALEAQPGLQGGPATVVPASLLQPLVAALPPPDTGRKARDAD